MFPPMSAGINTRFLVDTGATLRLARQPRRPPVLGDALFTGPGELIFWPSSWQCSLLPLCSCLMLECRIQHQRFHCRPGKGWLAWHIARSHL